MVLDNVSPDAVKPAKERSSICQLALRKSLNKSNKHNSDVFVVVVRPGVVVMFISLTIDHVHY